MRYTEIKRAEEVTLCIILTAPDRSERLLFYKSIDGYDNYIIERQIPHLGEWKGTQGLNTDIFAPVVGGGGCAFRKWAGNIKYCEYFDKGYRRDEMSLYDVRWTDRGRQLHLEEVMQ